MATHAPCLSFLGIDPPPDPRKTTIVGADIVELMPIPGLVVPDFLAARLAYRIIGLAAWQRRWFPEGLGKGSRITG